MKTGDRIKKSGKNNLKGTIITNLIIHCVLGLPILYFASNKGNNSPWLILPLLVLVFVYFISASVGAVALLSSLVGYAVSVRRGNKVEASGFNASLIIRDIVDNPAVLFDRVTRKVLIYGDEYEYDNIDLIIDSQNPGKNQYTLQFRFIENDYKKPSVAFRDGEDLLAAKLRISRELGLS